MSRPLRPPHGGLVRRDRQMRESCRVLLPSALPKPTEPIRKRPENQRFSGLNYNSRGGTRTRDPGIMSAVLYICVMAS